MRTQSSYLLDFRFWGSEQNSINPSAIQKWVKQGTLVGYSFMPANGLAVAPNQVLHLVKSCPRPEGLIFQDLKTQSWMHDWKHQASQLWIFLARINTYTPLWVVLLFSHPFVSDTLWSHGLQPARPPCPSPFPEVCPRSCPLSKAMSIASVMPSSHLILWMMIILNPQMQNNWI